MAKFLKKLDWVFISMLLLMATGYVLIHDLFGGTLFAHSHWDSYTLQAMAWRKGQLHLDGNYEWLELAIYEGQYFVSFPPVPTLVMLPLTFIFGENTPNNLVVALYAIITAALIYKCFRKAGAKDIWSAFWAIVFVWGSNAMWMSTNGGVWFQAQMLNFLLLSAAVFAAQRDKRGWALSLSALAVGCRPFSIIYLLAFIVLFAFQDADIKKTLHQWKLLIVPALIGISYMVLNYLRFGNPLEFGHNYLPEFQEDAQFGMQYALPNLINILRPVGFGKNGSLSYSVFNGFCLFIANPIFLIWLANIVSDARKKMLSKEQWVNIAGALLVLLCLVLHKTFGGWQFGARYTVDIIPFVLMYMLGQKRELCPKRYELAFGVFAVMFNVYGALAMTFLHG